MGQGDGIESPEKSPHTCGQANFDKGAMVAQWGKGQSQQPVLGRLDTRMQRTSLEPYLAHIQKSN